MRSRVRRRERAGILPSMPPASPGHDTKRPEPAGSGRSVIPISTLVRFRSSLAGRGLLSRRSRFLRCSLARRCLVRSLGSSALFGRGGSFCRLLLHMRRLGYLGRLNRLRRLLGLRFAVSGRNLLRWLSRCGCLRLLQDQLPSWHRWSSGGCRDARRGGIRAPLWASALSR